MITKIGALTSKPFAFVARSWELASLPSVDIYDSLLGSVRLDIRGNEVLRVLPLINEDLNQEWITDKARFSYDGLRRQRLLTPVLNPIRMLSQSNFGFSLSNNSSLFGELLLNMVSLGALDKVLKRTDFNLAKTYLRNILVTNTTRDTVLRIGKDTDLESLVTADLAFSNSLGRASFVSDDEIFTQNGNEDLSIYGLSPKVFNTSKNIYLVNVNLRWESPLLNLRVLSRVRTDALRVYTIGSRSLLNYKHVNLGSSPAKFFAAFALGKHPAFRGLKRLDASLFLLSTTLSFYASALQRLTSKFNSNVAVLLPWASSFSLLQRGAGWSKAFARNALHVSLGASSESGNCQTSVLFAAYGHVNYAKASALVFPVSGYTESQQHFFNLFGTLREAPYAVTVAKDVVPFWRTILELSFKNQRDVVGLAREGNHFRSENFFSSVDLAEESSFSNSVPSLVSNYTRFLFNKSVNVYETVPDYFRTHFSVRASRPMALASARFALANRNFI